MCGRRAATKVGFEGTKWCLNNCACLAADESAVHCTAVQKWPLVNNPNNPVGFKGSQNLNAILLVLFYRSYFGGRTPPHPFSCQSTKYNVS